MHRPIDVIDDVAFRSLFGACPPEKDLPGTAKEYLARVDAAETLRDEVINLIHKHWPRDAPASTTAGAVERQEGE